MWYFAADDPISSATNYYFTQGVLGITVVILAFVLIYLYRQSKKDLKEKDDIIAAKDAKIIEIMEARRADVVETTKEVTSVLSSNSQAMAILSEKIAVGKAEGRR